MKKETVIYVSVILLVSLMLSGCSLETKSVHKETITEPISIIPKPMKVQQSEGAFILDSSTSIYIEKDNAQIADIGKYLAHHLKPATGYRLPVRKTAKTNPISRSILLTTKLADITLGAEGYELIVKPDSILLRAPNPAGLFYGAQTIRQLLPPQIESKDKVESIAWTIPCAAITDKPAFTWRGYMLDSCRHFQTIDFIKRYIDLLAYHKMNIFHWHLTEDEAWRIEIKKYPKLTEIGAWPGDTESGFGGYYTQKEIREVVAYAKTRYITVVPEVDIPGHTNAALFAYPEYSCTGGPFEVGTFGDGEKYFMEKHGRLAICAGNNKTYKFLKEIFAEVIDMFDTPYIHVGGDERPEGNWDKCPKCTAKIKELGLKSESHLQNWFMDQINDFIQSRNRRTICWAENMEDGIPKNQIVRGWHAGETEYAVQEAGFESIHSEHSHCYLDYPAHEGQQSSHADWMPILTIEQMYSFDVIPADFTIAQSKLILGTEAPLWTEQVPQNRTDEKTFPRLLATIELSWSPSNNRSFEEFRDRIKHHLKRLDLMEVKYDTTLPALQ